MKTTAQIRESFQKYFEQHGHMRVESACLIPINDPTLLFVNAGMVPFKNYFLGEEKPPFLRATSVQRCVRAGGKHNDLDNVGYTARHHTFFEMLGNFSFGDYFKKEAISFAWDYLTNVLNIPKNRLWVSVYKEDLESANIWIKDIGIDPDRISYCGKKDNFWSMGDTGPCGPCSEIFYDHGDDIPGGPPGTPEEDGDRFIEIWNMVFMQYNRLPNGDLEKLPQPCIDTGMGLERISAVLQHVHNNYEIDLFQGLLSALNTLFGLQANDQIKTKRVIADHIRSVAFLIADGVVPSNEGRGYVLRRIIRRAVRHGFHLGLNEAFFYKMVAPLVVQMGDAYPILKQQQHYIEQIILQEEEQFARTLSKGMKVLEQSIDHMDGVIISGELAFTMYDTFGFPLDLTADIARERGLIVDSVGFEKHMAKQKEQSKKASQFSQEILSATYIKDETEFLGYQTTQIESQIVRLLKDGLPVNVLQEGELGCVVLMKTPFYPQGGGQVGDTGYLHGEQGLFHVKDTQKQGQAILHIGHVENGSFRQDDIVNAQVDSSRVEIASNHSATHLLHAALRYVLGEHVLQKGSLVNAQYLRFDFAHHESLTPDQQKDVEDLVNLQIRRNLAATIEMMSVDEAKKSGAMALFGEKYGTTVRVLKFGDFSIELCGGIHVNATGDIGLFKIIKEEAIASGVRRIEAVTGKNAIECMRGYENQVEKIADLLHTDKKQVLHKLEQQLTFHKDMQIELQKFKDQDAKNQLTDILASGQMISDCYVLTAILENLDAAVLRGMVDSIQSQRQDYAIFLANKIGDKVQLIAGVGSSVRQYFNANDLLNFVAKPLGGKGGGRLDFAQGSVKNSDIIPSIIATIPEWIATQTRK
jgi:alanyl-tRNA synthetase